MQCNLGKAVKNAIKLLEQKRLTKMESYHLGIGILLEFLMLERNKIDKKCPPCGAATNVF